jgi:hypothetical protein
MQDRVPAPNREGFVQLVPQEGGQNKYTLTPADNALVEGTVMNKASILSDEAAIAVYGSEQELTKAGLTLATVTPNNCFNKMAQRLNDSGKEPVGTLKIAAKSPDESNGTVGRWLRCDGGRFDRAKYPDLYLLYNGTVLDDLHTQEDRNSKYFVKASMTDVN